MKECCANCLNAYQNKHSPEVHCWNKEWEAQFREIETTVSFNESCGTFQRRDEKQPPLHFPPVQLSLF